LYRGVWDRKKRYNSVKKSLISIMAVAMCLGIVGSSYAYFTDVETSLGNTFIAGTLGLEIKDNSTWDPDPWGHGVDQTWLMDLMVPGESWVTNYIALRETGTIPADHVEISFTSTIDEQTNPPGLNPMESDTNPDSVAGDLAKWLEVTSMLFSGVDLKCKITGGSTPGWDFNGNGWLDLDDLANSPAIAGVNGPLDNLDPPHLTGGEGSLHVTVMFHAGATNDIQGDTLTTTVTFTLNQDVSQ
jgi:predicted ribosomally synthesized peptide with SipW-like signal peptide